MLLVADAGNTNIHIGCYDGKELLCRFALGVSTERTYDEYAFILRSLLREGGCEIGQIDGVMIGSVVPSLTDTLKKAIAKLTDAEITVPLCIDGEAPVLTVGNLGDNRSKLHVIGYWSDRDGFRAV